MSFSMGDVWSEWAAAVALDRPSAATCREVVKHYDWSEVMVEAHWLRPWILGEKSPRECLEENSAFFLSGADVGVVELARVIRENGLRLAVTLDWHNNGRGEPSTYHTKPPDNDFYAPFSGDGLRNYQRIMNAVIDVLDPDILQFANEPSYANGWKGISTEEYTSYLQRLVLPTKAPPVRLAGSFEEWSVAQTAANTLSKHNFVFPTTRDPVRLRQLVASRTREAAMRTGLPVWQDEGAGVGRMPGGTTTHLGADLTEAYIRGCHDANAGCGLLVVGGLSPIRSDTWRVTMALVSPGGNLTAAGERVLDVLHDLADEEHEQEEEDEAQDDGPPDEGLPPAVITADAYRGFVAGVDAVWKAGEDESNLKRDGSLRIDKVARLSALRLAVDQLLGWKVPVQPPDGSPPEEPHPLDVPGRLWQEAGVRYFSCAVRQTSHGKYTLDWQKVPGDFHHGNESYDTPAEALHEALAGRITSQEGGRS